MHITGMSIGAIPPISERITIKFDERVNVFIGPNASGKSTVLRWINLQIPRAVPDAWVTEDLDEGCTTDSLGVSENWREPETYTLLAGAPPPVITISPIRLPLPESSNAEIELEEADNSDDILEREFSGVNLKLAVETLTEEVWDMEPDRSSPYISLKGNKWNNYYTYPERYNLRKVRDIVDRCVRMICSEVIRGSSSHNYVPGLDVRGYLQGPRGAEPIEVHLDMAVDTNDIRNFEHLSPFERPSESAYHQGADSLPIYAGQMSSGIQGTLLWVRWVALKMVSHYEFRTDWEEMPAILLIDEIENHLHPTWQRRVIPALLEHFPGLQIFATTHSPFVVAGLKAGQVHMLKRDANGVVTASTNQHDMIGWTTDEILRTFMGVDEPTDQLTIDRRERLLELRRKDALTDEEAAEMEELRRQVNEDFLSSSTPLEAQRERYGDMMLEFLRSRQSELSQDGS